MAKITAVSLLFLLLGVAATAVAVDVTSTAKKHRDASVGAGGGGKLLWSAELFASTYLNHEYASGMYGPGYSIIVSAQSSSSRVGKNTVGAGDEEVVLYVTSDIEGRLYVLDARSGQILWTFNYWAKLPTPQEMGRQIVGTNSTVAVLRQSGENTMHVYGFNAWTGNVLYLVKLGGPGSSTCWSSFDGSSVPQFSLYNKTHFFLSTRHCMALFEMATGSQVWSVTSSQLVGGIQTAVIEQVVLGDGAVSAPSQNVKMGVVYTNTMTLNHFVGYYTQADLSSTHGNSGIRGNFKYDALSSAPYLMMIGGNSVGGDDALMWLSWGKSGDFYSRYNTTIEDFVYKDAPTGTSQSVGGYGMGATHFYFCFESIIVSYNITNGAKVAETKPIVAPGSGGALDHCLGYPDYAVIGVKGIGAPGNLTVKAFDAQTMAEVSSDSALSFVGNPTPYGNWAGDIMVPSSSGFTVFDDSGALLADATGIFSNLTLKSMCLTNTKAFFTFGAMAAAVDFTAARATSAASRTSFSKNSGRGGVIGSGVVSKKGTSKRV